MASPPALARVANPTDSAPALPTQRNGRYIILLGPDAGSALSVPGLWVGQTAPLLAHASYAAAGPVYRVDGDANNELDPLCAATPLVPARLALLEAQDHPPAPLPGKFGKWRCQRPADHANTLDAFLESFGGARRVSSCCANCPAHSTSSHSQWSSYPPERQSASGQHQDRRRLTKLEPAPVPMRPIFVPSMVHSCVGHLARRLDCFLWVRK
jgi:hypothetical protein